ncbi:AbrB family transcriptional regulator [Companilactobacillus alimentarius]|uniref:AbrB family transcriptional regulator n=1 Tax=Companilactobacillus alimentarius TaxID=1602 RepID=UPI0028B313B0|nr:AbrB family transcriptional regulator [Companilactobacillus alimentarius]MDT6951540.1 AbrB family transcriptional regulator [Companilactobacillus alimentarius]
MINPEDLKQVVTMIKDGDSYAFPISKKDSEFLNADDKTRFEKTISPDGKEITFKKIEKVRPNVLETANKLYDDHADLMKGLENL